MDGLEVFDDIERLDETDVPDFAKDEIEEFAPSMEVQVAEIREVFDDIPELSFDSWEHLDVDERVEALQQLENEVAEIAHRPPIEVQVETLEPNVQGYFDGQKIVISVATLSDATQYKEVLNTLFHEGRHAYQNFNLYSGTIVEQNQEMVNAWRVNLDFLGYEDGDALLFKDIGFARYYTQPIEVDARTFADAAMRALNI